MRMTKNASALSLKFDDFHRMISEETQRRPKLTIDPSSEFPKTEFNE
jgi:predicted HAD superfamily Cof-like phosphohydrolase